MGRDTIPQVIGMDKHRFQLLAGALFVHCRCLIGLDMVQDIFLYEILHLGIKASLTPEKKLLLMLHHCTGLSVTKLPYEEILERLEVATEKTMQSCSKWINSEETLALFSSQGTNHSVTRQVSL